MQQNTTNNDKEYVTIEGQKYYIKRIPALEAERMFFEVLPVLQSLDITKLPFSFVAGLMPYCGICNSVTNTEIDFVNDDLISMYVTKPSILMELQARVLGKNFSFFSDGSLTRVMSVLSNAFPVNTGAIPSGTPTSVGGAAQSSQPA